MLRRNNATRLQETVKGVETMTRFALAVLALASGVYTYLGVRGLLDGTATFVFFAAIIYSAAVSVAIYAFWTFMLRFVPLVTNAAQRVALFGRAQALEGRGQKAEAAAVRARFETAWKRADVKLRSSGFCQARS